MILETVDRSDRRLQLTGVVSFLVLAFAFSWGQWSVVLLPDRPLDDPLTVVVLALGMWGPGLSALLVTRLVLHENWRTTTIDRLGRRFCFLWAWLLPAAGTAATMLLTVLVGLARFDPEFTHLRNAVAAAHAPLTIPLGLMVAIGVIGGLTVGPLFNTLFAVGEELGWRGFLLLRLMRAGLGQWSALILSGVIWGLWHAPVIARGHNYPDHPYLGILLMTGFTTLLGVIFGWLQLASGSVWVPALAHGALNAIAGVPTVLLTQCDTAIGGTLAGVIGWVPLIAFIGWLAWTGRLPVRQPPEVATVTIEPA